jgi:hypothetical protein
MSENEKKRGPKPKPMLERLTAALALHTHEDGDCQIWTGRLSGSGGVPKLGKNSVRRLIWERDNAPLQPGELMSAGCGNNRCLAHLVKSTKSEVSTRVHANPANRAALKVASAKWARANLAKLDVQKAREIRASTENQHTLGIRYGVDHSLISKIQTGRAWADLVASPFAGLGARA